jgi:hypothetical protein
MLDRFSKIQYITSYLEKKRQETASWNTERHVATHRIWSTVTA